MQHLSKPTVSITASSPFAFFLEMNAPSSLCSLEKKLLLWIFYNVTGKVIEIDVGAFSFLFFSFFLGSSYTQHSNLGSDKLALLNENPFLPLSAFQNSKGEKNRGWD